MNFKKENMQLTLSTSYNDDLDPILSINYKYFLDSGSYLTSTYRLKQKNKDYRGDVVKHIDKMGIENDEKILNFIKFAGESVNHYIFTRY